MLNLEAPVKAEVTVNEAAQEVAKGDESRDRSLDQTLADQSPERLPYKRAANLLPDPRKQRPFIEPRVVATSHISKYGHCRLLPPLALAPRASMTPQTTSI
jgi:hypothetical protein